MLLRQASVVADASLFQMAVQLHRAGQVDRAEALYRQVLDKTPQHGDALFLLSMLTVSSGRLAEAAALLERAVRVAPNNATFLLNLGNVYRSLGRSSEAVTVLLVAISRKPESAEAVASLGLTFEEQGDLRAAVQCYERAQDLEPGLGITDRLHSLKHKLDRVADATGPAPTRGSEAATSSAEYLAALGETLRLGGNREEALVWYRMAAKLNPRLAGTQAVLGAMQAEVGRFDEAIEHFRQALEVDPSQNYIRDYLATALGESGLLDEARAMHRQAIASFPDDPNVHSALIFNMQFWPDVTAADILAEARAWNMRHAQSLARAAPAPKNNRSPDRRLRIGYVSPDFRSHVLALMMVPLFQNHDHEHFEIYCYSSVENPDQLTQRIRGYADTFREVKALNDAALAEIIRKDQIDILIDVTMHMVDRRLLTFARRPAPVQVCWLAYPGTTGLETMDYRISDPYLDPPGTNTDVYSERTLRLPDTFWCYDPLSEGPDVSPLPALKAGKVTFGCLNHFKKLNAGVLRLWAKVLNQVLDSRLMVMAPQGSARDRVRAVFEQEGVKLERIEFVERQGRLGYLGRYREIDVCLDTFPYNGHTTSLDALWMGVPTVTLEGERVVGRAGVCQAMNLGLSELVAKTPEQFVQSASALANDLERLAQLRLTLRDRMTHSPLMDGPRYARNMEAAYRDVWRIFCASG